MAGEQGKDRPELIIDGDAYKKMNPDIKYSIHREIARVKGYESGLYPDGVEAPNYTENSTTDTRSNDLLVSVLNRAVIVLEKLEESGVIATMTNKDLKSMKNIQDGIDDYNALRNKNKV